MKRFFQRIRDFFSNIPFKTYVTILLEGIGLFANIIAIVTFFGTQNTPQESPNFYINNQEFFVWSLIAVIYTLGLISARFKRRWRRKLAEAGYEEEYYDNSNPYTKTFKQTFFRSPFHYHLFVRDFSFTLAIIFPLTLLYVRAMQAAATEGTASPWVSLGITVFICVPATLGVMISSSIFDKALSLYAGD
jgi:hypothetical protein